MSVICPEGHTSTSTDYCDVCGAPIPASAVTTTGGSSGPVGGPTPAASTGGGAPGGSGGPVTCPSCGELSPAGSLFCENCGYDFTTGTPVVPAAPASSLDLGDLGRPGGSGGGVTGTAGGAIGGPVHAPGAPADPAQASPVSGQVVISPPPAHGPASAAAAGGGEQPTSGTTAEAGGLAAPPVPGPDAWVAEIWVDPDWYLAQEPEDPMPSPGLPGLVTLRQRSLLVGRPSQSRGIHPDIDCGADSGVSRRHCQLSTDGQRWWVEDLQSANGTFVATAGDPIPTTPITPGQRREVGDGDRVYLGGWTRVVIRKALPGEA
ncbi:FHA domain-containing protein [Antribacter sp. KLBMP9083]|uniref:FHA domain-containing protein n=1 Tax=Antribacter soli TaxID=2910976 RepID=A0AA41QAW1_9MICO|nr:FHA domain-containing protein [Antribacter soli]MCF4119741.1 FHA domain-containing protein [Antribacter soli]